MKFIISILLLYSTYFVCAQEKTFEREYTYQASELDSKASCRAIAINQLRAQLLNEVGVYVESEQLLKTTDTKGVFSQNFTESIATISAGITKLQVIDEKWDGTTFWMKAAITIDKKSLEESLNQLIADRRKVKELEDLKQQLEATNKNMEILKAELLKTKNDQEKETIGKKYNSALDVLKSYTNLIKPSEPTGGLYEEHLEYFNKGMEYYNAGEDFESAYYYLHKAFLFGRLTRFKVKPSEELLRTKALYMFLSILKIPKYKTTREDVHDAKELVDDRCDPSQKKQAYEAYDLWKKRKDVKPKS